MAYLDLVWLGLLRDRDGQPQYPVAVGGLDGVRVEAVAQEQLPAEHATWPLGGHHLMVWVSGGAFGVHGECVVLDIEIEGVCVDAG